ncbi:hypothetical protein EBT16_01730 [bacterium]|nr:hypothetical protein [bacterium]
MNAATPVVKAYADPVVATDNDAVLCWCEEVVERAVGEINAFEQIKSPVYYGDIYSFEVRMGGRIRRSDEKGIVAIVQAAGDGN